jgi:hypothetical protein
MCTTLRMTKAASSRFLPAVGYKSPKVAKAFPLLYLDGSSSSDLVRS